MIITSLAPTTPSMAYVLEDQMRFNFHLTTHAEKAFNPLSLSMIRNMLVTVGYRVVDNEDSRIEDDLLIEWMAQVMPRGATGDGFCVWLDLQWTGADVLIEVRKLSYLDQTLDCTFAEADAMHASAKRLLLRVRSYVASVTE